MMSDLFYSVLYHYHPTYDPIARRTLVALAQTCRALSEPSLDYLWRTLDSLEPLIRCYTNVDDVENIIPPTAAQFAVIERYSYRVRDAVVSRKACLRFLQCTSMQPFCLLPNLVALSWNFGSPSYLPIILIQRLLTPTLVSLEMTFAETDGATLLSFFDSLPLLCPDLKSIRFQFLVEPQSPTTIQALSHAICNLTMLETVILGCPVDDIALRYLSTLPTLTDLTVQLSKISRPRSYTFPSIDPLFCNVEELEFETTDLDLVTGLIRPRDQIFYAFCLRYHDRLTSDAAIAFLNALASPSRTEPLTKFTLSSGSHTDFIPADEMANEAPRYRLSFETLQPLMVFETLRYLMIEWGEQISLDDDELTSLARSWPCLERFILRCACGGYPPFSTKYPTLRGLLSLVTSCPDLRMASLPLDATQVPDGEEEAPSCGAEFTCLLLPESPIDQAFPVAQFLFKYFPRVGQVEGLFLDPPPGVNISQIKVYKETWQQVGRHLKEFRRSLPALNSAELQITDDGDVTAWCSS